MLRMPDDVVLYILDFLPLVPPLSTRSVSLSRSNVVWAPRLQQRFGLNSPRSFYEYHWQQHLARHAQRYKHQWTMGCVGKRVPPVPPPFLTAHLARLPT